MKKGNSYITIATVCGFRSRKHCKNTKSQIQNCNLPALIRILKMNFVQPNNTPITNSQVFLIQKSHKPETQILHKNYRKVAVRYYCSQKQEKCDTCKIENFMSIKDPVNQFARSQVPSYKRATHKTETKNLSDSRF